MTGLAVAQTRLEQKAFWRNPEAAFFTFALPVGLVAIFGATAMEELQLFVPGVVAFGIVAAAYGNLASTLAVLRAEGTLKRVRATPLPPGAYLAGHLLSVLATCLLAAVAAISVGGLAFGARPDTGELPGLVAVAAAGVVCFAAFGLAVSALIRSADAAGAVTNATYLPLALVSGTFDPSLHLPGWLEAVVGALPVKALTDGLRAAYDPAVAGWPARSLLVLGGWAVVGIVLARRVFRWEPG